MPPWTPGAPCPPWLSCSLPWLGPTPPWASPPSPWPHSSPPWLCWWVLWLGLSLVSSSPAPLSAGLFPGSAEARPDGGKKESWQIAKQVNKICSLGESMASHLYLSVHFLLLFSKQLPPPLQICCLIGDRNWLVHVVQIPVNRAHIV